MDQTERYLTPHIRLLWIASLGNRLFHASESYLISYFIEIVQDYVIVTDFRKFQDI